MSCKYYVWIGNRHRILFYLFLWGLYLKRAFLPITISLREWQMLLQRWSYMPKFVRYSFDLLLLGMKMKTVACLPPCLNDQVHTPNYSAMDEIKRDILSGDRWCSYSSWRGMGTLVRVPAIFKTATKTFVTSCLLSCTLQPSGKWSHLKKKKNIFPFLLPGEADIYIAELSLLQMYPFALKY